MTGYLQRLFDRAAPAAPVAPAADAAGRLTAPMAEADQRLMVPGLEIDVLAGAWFTAPQDPELSFEPATPPPLSSMPPRELAGRPFDEVAERGAQMPDAGRPPLPSVARDAPAPVPVPAQIAAPPEAAPVLPPPIAADAPGRMLPRESALAAPSEAAPAPASEARAPEPIKVVAGPATRPAPDTASGAPTPMLREERQSEPATAPIETSDPHPLPVAAPMAEPAARRFQTIGSPPDDLPPVGGRPEAIPLAQPAPRQPGPTPEATVGPAERATPQAAAQPAASAPSNKRPGPEPATRAAETLLRAPDAGERAPPPTAAAASVIGPLPEYRSTPMLRGRRRR